MLQAVFIHKSKKTFHFMLNKHLLHFLKCLFNVKSKSISRSVVSNSFQSHGLQPSRQEYWSGYPFPSPGDVSNPGIKSGFPALQADSFLSEPPEKPLTSPDYYFHCILVSSALLYSLHLSFPIHSPHRSIMTF